MVAETAAAMPAKLRAIANKAKLDAVAAVAALAAYDKPAPASK